MMPHSHLPRAKKHISAATVKIVCLSSRAIWVRQQVPKDTIVRPPRDTHFRLVWLVVAAAVVGIICDLVDIGGLCCWSSHSSPAPAMAWRWRWRRATAIHEAMEANETPNVKAQHCHYQDAHGQREDAVRQQHKRPCEVHVADTVRCSMSQLQCNVDAIGEQVTHGRTRDGAARAVQTGRRCCRRADYLRQSLTPPG